MKNNKDQITRKEAIKKMAKYSALTAVGTFIILNPKKAQAFSPSDPGGNPLGREMENLNFPFLLREMENFD